MTTQTLKPNSQWNTTDKANARYITVIESYQRLFQQTIPKNQHIWSMCGQHTDEYGNVEESSQCELPEFLRHKLIQSPHQYHGIDKSEECIRLNKLAYPTANWYRGDFYRTIKKNRSIFNPAIVNMDTTSFPNLFMAEEITSLLEFAGTKNNNTLFVINVPLTFSNIKSRKSTNDLIQHLNSIYRFHEVLRKYKWRYEKDKKGCMKVYSYNMTGKTDMASYLFWRYEK